MAITRRVGGKGQHIAVITRLESAKGEIFKTFRHLILIKQNLGTGAVLRFTSQIGRILFAFLGLVKIPMIAHPDRHAQIGLFDSPKHFLIKSIRKPFVLAHKRLGIGILSRQILDYRRVLLLIPITHPRVVVGYLITVNLQNLRLFLSNWCFHNFLGNDHDVADYDDDE